MTDSGEEDGCLYGCWFGLCPIMKVIGNKFGDKYMEINLKQTSRIVNINDVPARVWEGTTAKGTKITAFISKIAVEKSEDSSELENELQETEPPKASNHWPLNMVL